MMKTAHTRILIACWILILLNTAFMVYRCGFPSPGEKTVTGYWRCEKHTAGEPVINLNELINQEGRVNSGDNNITIIHAPEDSGTAAAMTRELERIMDFTQRYTADRVAGRVVIHLVPGQEPASYVFRGSEHDKSANWAKSAAIIYETLGFIHDRSSWTAAANRELHEDIFLVAPHEITEMTLVKQLKIDDPFTRWFRDGLAEYVAARYASLHCPEAHRQWRETRTAELAGNPSADPLRWNSPYSLTISTVENGATTSSVTFSLPEGGTDYVIEGFYYASYLIFERTAASLGEPAFTRLLNTIYNQEDRTSEGICGTFMYFLGPGDFREIFGTVDFRDKICGYKTTILRNFFKQHMSRPEDSESVIEKLALEPWCNDLPAAVWAEFKNRN